jgi:phosphoribosyl-ATP pyrophosphohydrolase/phosphoribosyl-AMP cyclohydrolase/histidinol dehydrogenase
MLRRLSAGEVMLGRRVPVDPETLAAAAEIVEDVRLRGEAAVLEHAERLGDLAPGDKAYYTQPDLRDALDAIAPEDNALLERTAQRLRVFALAQRSSLVDTAIAIPGGRAGHRVTPIATAGCYAPGGRFPLPSSVLMTAVTAQAAGVRTVWVASPRPTALTLAAAAISEAHGLLAVGGAQAIAALAFGAGPVPACDVVVGPGNRWVTAAKQLVAGFVAIDMLAGPSELLVIADAQADPSLIAADLLAQAEHDPDAFPALISLDAGLVDTVEREMERQLADLPAADVARTALSNGFAVLVASLDEALDLANALAPEHLELDVAGAEQAAQRLHNYGSLFIGLHSAEVLGDYGAGPNHVLPTGGTARYTGGLSVLTFLKVATWLQIDDPEAAAELTRDALSLARHEGLEAHARAAELRLP